jgi:hypothetical protein
MVNNSPLWRLREFDTAPHTINARTGPWLQFMGSEHFVKTRSVNHPGTKGNYIVTRVWAASEDAMWADIVGSVNRWKQRRGASE